MKLLLLFALIGLSLAEFNSYDEFKKTSTKSVSDYALDLGFKTFDQQFKKFKLDHNRQYGSVDEEERRKFNFLKTLVFIEKHNELYKRGEVTHEVGISLFADMTEEEYLKSFSMPSPLALNKTLGKPVYYDNIVPLPNLPASFDWRAQGKVTPIKNQGQCGSCWAFTTCAIIESGYAIHHNQHVILSEQQLVDCTNSNCGGKYINDALEYVHQHGVEQQSEYPYQAHAYQCREDTSRFHARISGYRMMGKAANRATATDAEIMTTLMSVGPLGLMFDAYGSDFSGYRGGVLSTGLTEWKAVHAVTLVGWGSENGVDYWIIKNSWGPTWGVEGYLKLARGKDLRGVNEYLYYPTF